MTSSYIHQLILETLKTTSKPLSIGDIATKFPALGWNQVFLAVDYLSRQGLLLVKRHGFDYLCELPQ